MEEQKKRLVKNFTSLGIVQIANYILPMIVIPIVSRIIGPEKFGAINFSASFVGYFVLLIGYGFTLTGTRRLAGNPNDRKLRNQVFSEVFYSQLLLFAISTIIFFLCLHFVKELQKDKVLSVYSFLLCISTLLTQDWLFQAMQDLTKVAILNFVSKFLFIASVLYFVQTSEDYRLYALLLSISNIIIAICSFVWSIKQYGICLVPIKWRDVIKLIWAEKQYFFSLVLMNVYTSTLVIYLGFLGTQEDVGYFSASWKIIMIIQSLVILPLRQALFPYMTKLIHDNKDKAVEMIASAFPSVLIVMLTICLGIFFLSEYIIQIIYGNEYTKAVNVLKIISFAPLFVTLNNIWGVTFMLNLKLDKVYLKILLRTAVISLALAPILVIKFRENGAALSWLISEGFIALSLFRSFGEIEIKLVDSKYFRLSIWRSLFNRKSK